jgi:hypothetical protein
MIAINTAAMMLKITYPKILIYRKKDSGDMDCGLHFTDLDTGIFYSRYDYGRIFKLQLLGIGVDIWWL